MDKLDKLQEELDRLYARRDALLTKIEETEKLYREEDERRIQSMLLREGMDSRRLLEFIRKAKAGGILPPDIEPENTNTATITEEEEHEDHDEDND